MSRISSRTPSRKGRTRVVDGDMSRLPLWAQNKINYLKRDLDEERARFASLGRVLDPLMNEPRGTISYGSYRREIEIPGGDSVTFHLGDGREIRARFNDETTGVHLMGSDTFEISMQASNTFDLHLVRDRVREKLLEAQASESARNILLRPREHDGSYRGPKKS